MDADGGNCQPLTFSALNEQSPAVLPDGRIIYHRWEYVDKAAGNAKALWAITPTAGAAEVYGDNIPFPESMMYPRPIPIPRIRSYSSAPRTVVPTTRSVP